MPVQDINETEATPSERHLSMNKNSLRVGRHYSGGKELLIGAAQALSEPASAMQIFAMPKVPKGKPSYWGAKIEPEYTAKFNDLTDHMYKMVHAPYLLNIGEDPDERNWRMSIHSLVNQLEWAENHHCQSLVFHPGAPKTHTLDQSLEWAEYALREIFATYTGPVQLLLENAASTKKIGGRLKDLVHLCDQIDDERLGICVDTTHAFASGDPVPKMLEYLDWTQDYIKVIHLNTPDHRVEKVGSCRDFHSSGWSEGMFSLTELQMLFVKFKHLPLILEGTPDLAADLAWMLKWELEIREYGEPTKPPVSDVLGDIFALAD